MDHAMPEPKPKKRKPRRVLSCNDCRRRKLKCDRELPCNRCINGGIAESCAYPHAPTGPSSERARSRTSPYPQSPIPTSHPWGRSRPRRTESALHPPANGSIQEDPAERRIQELESRLGSLETLLSSIQKTSSSQSPDAALERISSSVELSFQVPSLFKGRHYSTFFHGPTSTMAIISQFPQLAHFMKDIYPGSTLERLTGDHRALWDRARTNKAFGQPLVIPSLRSLLPDRETVDLLVKRYFETFETMYRILHIPTFWEEYKSFWDASSGANSDLDAIVLAILACTITTSTHAVTSYDADGSVFRSKAIVWIKGCEGWLKRQSNKHRTLATLQVRCLRLLALSTSCRKTKEYYQEVESHMAFMTSCGIHQDLPILGSRCSVFEQEMRRRIWATSLELELQASIDKGSPTVLSSLEYDCLGPQNINDSELKIEMQELPPSHPITQYTDSSFLHCASHTSSLRMKLCALATRPHNADGFSSTLQYEQEVQEHLEKLPCWEESKSLQARVLLDLQLRQFLVILHTPRVFQCRSFIKSEERYAVLMCLQSSIELIERHTSLMDLGNFVLCCMRSEYYRAALLICYVAYHSRAWSDAIITQVAKMTLDNVMEKALRLQEERAMRPGRGSHQYWYISAACSLVGIQFEPSQAEILKRSAIDRVARLLYKTLSLQENLSDESLASELILGDMRSFNDASKIPMVSASVPDSLIPGPFPGFDIMSASDWILDDFYFG